MGVLTLFGLLALSPPQSSRLDGASGAALDRMVAAIRVRRRILVLGSPGIGKTQFSERLAPALGLPLYHLDDYYWRSGWKRPIERDWLNELTTLLKRPQWVIEGNFADSLAMRLARADCAIVLAA